MTGRKKALIWNKFKEIKCEGKSRALCKKCKKDMVPLVARMKEHFKKCSFREILEEESSDCSDESSEAHIVEVENSANSNSSTGFTTSQLSKNSYTETLPSTSSTGGAQPQNKIRKLDSFLTRTTENQKKLFDKQVAKFLFATNSAFRHVEHPEFKKLISILHPGYSPPNRRRVADDLLDEVYEEENKKIKDNLKGKIVCMSQDGWSNVHNESVICISVANVLDKTVDLCDTIDTADNSHTSEYLLELAINSIRSCQQYGCSVRSFVTDNAANMKKMRKDLAGSEELGMPDIITYGCSAHILNLLAHDVEIPDIKGNVKKIMKYFRNKQIAASKYKQAGGNKLVLPQDVRWNTLADCLESYLQNWHILVKVCSDNKLIIDKDILCLINDVNLKNNATDYLEKLKMISIALDNVQSDHCTIGEATEVWINLEQGFQKLSESDQIFFQKRFKMAMTPAHFLANLLDHRFRGNKLKSEYLDEAMEYASTYYTDALPHILTYKAKLFPFKEYLFSKALTNTQPMLWWLSIENLNPDMLSLVSQLHTAVASSAGIERLFSAFGLVHTKLRNRLGIAKAGKLVTILKSLNRTFDV